MEKVLDGGEPRMILANITNEVQAQVSIQHRELEKSGTE